MQKIVLDGIWELGICSNDTFRKNKINIVDLDSLCNSNITVIEGHVPGNYEIDLEKAGIIENPFYGKNLLKSLDREMDHLFYGKKFVLDKVINEKYILQFDGIDTIADIYLNGSLLAHTENMLRGYEFEVGEELLNKGDNELLVHIIPVSLEANENDMVN